MVKKVFFNGLADMVTLIAGVLSSVVLTRLLGPEQWGQYSQVTWLITSAGAVFSFGLTYTTIRYLGAISELENSSEAQPLVLWLIITQLILASIGGVLLFIFSFQIVNLTHWKLDPIFIRIAAFGLVSFTMIQIGISMLRGLQLFQLLSKLGIFNGIILLFVTLITFFYPSIQIMIIASMVGQVILLPWLFQKIWRHVQPKSCNKATFRWQPPTTWHYAIRYSSVMFVSVLLEQIVWQRSEIFFLAQLKDSSESGYYSLAYTICQLAICTIPAAITGTLTPIFSSLANSNNSSIIVSSYERYFSFLNLVILPLSLGLFIISPYLLEILYGKSYAAASPALRLLSISTAVGMYARPSVSVIHALKKPKVFAISNILALPVDLIFAWQLIPVMGAQGAAIANLAAQIIGAVVIISYATISIGLRYDFQSIGRSVLSTTLCCIVAWLVGDVVGTSILSIILAVTLGGITYVVALVCLCDRPTREIVMWMQEKAYQSLSNRRQGQRV